MSGDPAQADDLVQEALIRAYERIGRFAGASSFKTWLFAVGYREFLRGRRKAGLISRLLETLAQGEAPEPPRGPDAGMDLQRALSALEPPERAAVLLCDAGGMSHPEAAEAMDAPLGSVKTYVRRGRDKLRRAMEGDGDDQP